MNLPKQTLVIDGSANALFAGLLDSRGAWQATARRESAALEGLFPAVAEVLQATEQTIPEVNGFIYCEGPGSILSLRLCAMAIETWRRLRTASAVVYKYNSLQLAAWKCLAENPNLTDALIVSDWKKDVWNGVHIRDGQVGGVEAITDSVVREWPDRLYHLPQRKGWQSPPKNAKTLTYDPADLDQLHTQPGLLAVTDAVELYGSGINTFQKWTPTRHRAPS